MLLYPKVYLNNVREITMDLLEKNHIKGLILDVDNTLIDYYQNLPEETFSWCQDLKEKGIKMCILSNSNKKEKVKMVADKLNLPYRNFACKPFKSGFQKAMQVLELKNTEIAVVGDQIFTDVLGANRMNMFSILVRPIEQKDIWITILKRPLENRIIRNYQNKQK